MIEDPFVSPEFLQAHLTDPNIRIVDAGFKMPGVSPTTAEDYAREHIPGAVFFDIDRIAAEDTAPLPHMLPTPARFAEQVEALGIGSDHRVMLYGGAGIAGPARAWWMFRIFGHDQVYLLDGGLAGWKAGAGKTDSALPHPTHARFTARFHPELVRNRAQILAKLDTRDEQIVDARAAARFEGTVQEPWPGRRQGHIPGSINLDYTTLLDPDGRMLPPETLRGRFVQAGYDPARPVVTSCGSGITACVLALALRRAGLPDAAVYDGSWAEWGLPGNLPIEIGPARRAMP